MDTNLASDMSIFPPYFSRELVLRDIQWLHEVTVTQIDLDVFASRCKQNLWESPNPVAPLLQHEICGADVLPVVWWLPNSNDQRLSTSNYITDSIDLIVISRS